MPSAQLAVQLAGDRARALSANPVSRETLERLDAFVRLLLHWQERMNLIGSSTIPEIWTRHIADSLQLLRLAPDAKRWADLGSGAGFPGIVIASLLADNPEAQIHLIEKSPKKSEFLREVVQTLDLPALVYAERIEDLPATSAADMQVVTARALAPLPRLLEYVAPFVEKGAKALLPKGQDVEAELTEASKCWNIEAELIASTTNPAGRILVVTGLDRKR